MANDELYIDDPQPTQPEQEENPSMSDLKPWESVATANPYIPPEERPNALRRGGWGKDSGPSLLGTQLADYVNNLEAKLATAEQQINDVIEAGSIAEWGRLDALKKLAAAEQQAETYRAALEEIAKGGYESAVYGSEIARAALSPQSVGASDE